MIDTDDEVNDNVLKILYTSLLHQIKNTVRRRETLILHVR